jgi:hypothetical protein
MVAEHARLYGCLPPETLNTQCFKRFPGFGNVRNGRFQAQMLPRMLSSYASNRSLAKDNSVRPDFLSGQYELHIHACRAGEYPNLRWTLKNCRPS